MLWWHKAAASPDCSAGRTAALLLQVGRSLPGTLAIVCQTGPVKSTGNLEDHEDVYHAHSTAAAAPQTAHRQHKV